MSNDEKQSPKTPVKKGWKGDWVTGDLGPDAPRNEVHKQRNLRFLLTLIAFGLAWLLAQLVENPKPKQEAAKPPVVERVP